VHIGRDFDAAVGATEAVMAFKAPLPHGAVVVRPCVVTDRRI